MLTHASSAVMSYGVFEDLAPGPVRRHVSSAPVIPNDTILSLWYLKDSQYDYRAEGSRHWRITMQTPCPMENRRISCWLIQLGSTFSETDFNRENTTNTVRSMLVQVATLLTNPYVLDITLQSNSL